MFKKILIANRGEIAVRIIRACREMKIKTVAVYSTADANSLPVHLADESVCIGPPAPKDSYLNAPNIISAAHITGAEAIHPGIGFLSERPSFAEACEACGVKFIGPSAASMERMGDKSAARTTMLKAGVPVVPGTGIITSVQEAAEFAAGAVYPVLVKAAFGGGGRGIRLRQVVTSADFVGVIGAARVTPRTSAVFAPRQAARRRHINGAVFCHQNVVHHVRRQAFARIANWCPVRSDVRSRAFQASATPLRVLDVRFRLTFRIGQQNATGLRSQHDVALRCERNRRDVVEGQLRRGIARRPGVFGNRVTRQTDIGSDPHIAVGRANRDIENALTNRRF